MRFTPFIGKRHITRESTPVDDAMKDIITCELGTINATMAEPILITEVQLDVRSSLVRMQEVRLILSRREPG